MRSEDDEVARPGVHGPVTGSAGQPTLNHPHQQMIARIGPSGRRQRQADEVPAEVVFKDAGQEVVRHLSRISIRSPVVSMPTATSLREAGSGSGGHRVHRRTGGSHA